MMDNDANENPLMLKHSTLWKKIINFLGEYLHCVFHSIQLWQYTLESMLFSLYHLSLSILSTLIMNMLFNKVIFFKLVIFVSYYSSRSTLKSGFVFQKKGAKFCGWRGGFGCVLQYDIGKHTIDEWESVMERWKGEELWIDANPRQGFDNSSICCSRFLCFYMLVN